MPTPTNNSGLRDNHTRGTVADFLASKIQNGSKLSVVSAYFTIYAYDALRQALDRIDHLDFLFGEPSFVNRLDPSKTEKKAFIIDSTGLELSNKLQQKRVAKECADWIEQKVDIKTIKQSNLLHGKMYHVATAGVEDAILGSSNFTVRGLGLGSAGNNIELNLIVDGNRDRQELKQWFDDLWSNPALVKDVKQDVLNYLKQLYENNTPEFIYYKTLFHIFEKFLVDTDQTKTDLGKTSLFETEVWKALYEFQKDGVKGAINKILRHNGCIIADSVGLGKTYEALAVMKYFELKNERVLVLCPKKLRDNWTVYKANSLLNPFGSDRFRYDVLSHTDLSRETGYSGDINLATLNWGNYDLIVIDESHNFRNNTPGKKDEEGNLIRKSRYQRLMEDIIQTGIRTKVLLLSATPVNNDLKDLRNQLYFFTENKDDAFTESLGINSLKETLATAQKVFTHWARKHSAERKTGDLLEKLNASFFKLLDELTIARSRKHIQKYYKATLEELGGFPVRKKPVSVYPEIDLRGRFLSYDKINDEIAAYKLSLFNPSKYVKDEFKPDYQTATRDPFTQADREKFLIGMMKVNYLKRLESSVKSFEIAASLVNLNQSDLKLLVLDDLLVSLDMSNRMQVVDILLTDPIFANYQKIILTHDRGLFEEFRRMIGVAHSDWCFRMLHGNPKDGIYPKEEKDAFEKATDYLTGHDLEAAALQLRKAVEETAQSYLKMATGKAPKPGEFHSLSAKLEKARNILLNQLPLQMFKDVCSKVPKPHRDKIVRMNDHDIDADAGLTADEKARLKQQREKLKLFMSNDAWIALEAIDVLDAVIQMKDRVLNPAAHWSKTPLYDAEVKKALTLVARLEAILLK